MANPEPKPNCFIIMPISTPDLAAYSGDPDHFKHVLEHLFMPAVEKAGMTPIAPLAKGADLIQAEIVQHLEKDDFVLCDMSTLNANVFFELGIRTAVGKPVCVVKDDSTPKIPFDITVVNHDQYSKDLRPWGIAKEIDKLAEHLKETEKRCKGENMLWKYFSFSQRAHLANPAGDDTSDRLAILSEQVEGLSRKMEEKSAEITPNSFGNAEIIRQKKMIDALGTMNVSWHAIRLPNGTSAFLINEEALTSQARNQITNLALKFGCQVRFLD